MIIDFHLNLAQPTSPEVRARDEAGLRYTVKSASINRDVCIGIHMRVETMCCLERRLVEQLGSEKYLAIKPCFSG
jgi:hypothetical protein